VLINKVNEMQIKTSRFEQIGGGGMFRGAFNYNNEDYIPNEEPLINVREFWGSNINHNYRMRWQLSNNNLHSNPNVRLSS
jgi:hypothetical protein